MEKQQAEITRPIIGDIIVVEGGIASSSDSIKYFGFFSDEDEAENFINKAVETCVSNESFYFNEYGKETQSEEEGFIYNPDGYTKEEMVNQYRDCYRISSLKKEQISAKEVDN